MSETTLPRAAAAEAPSPQVCIFIPSFGDGGVEHMLVNAARGMAALGARVDFIVNQADGPYLDRLPSAVRLLTLGSRDQRDLLAEFRKYLRADRPAVVVSAKGRDDRIALKAKTTAPVGTRFFLRPGTAVTARLEERGTSRLRRWLKYRRMRRLYAQADGVVAVSEGVADEIARSTRFPRERIRVIRNPTITPELPGLSEAPVSHPWFAPGERPVILGVGGLRMQKDFATLIRAFARLRERRPARLMILGEGRQQARLQELARKLGVADDVRLPGFADNPYAYLRHAALFVLSSLWEGSPNVLTEALAIGTPVVSTDCRSGPREILQGGRFGPLVPVGDAEALARAMVETLENPLPAETLREATSEYTMEKSARRYLDAFGIEPFGQPSPP
ncbi:MAG: glycosyltransferase [Gammaproteobacteria bacterium]|jgi:glycosyltransferase involved in cell wall biosynthesis